jgi:hypothetical protein
MLEKKKDEEEIIASQETGMTAQATQPSAHIISTIGNATCDVCGRPMYDDNGRECIAVAIGVSDHPEADRVKEVFGKQAFNVCFVCFLRALGVKELK